ncbi:MAG: electron transport complex subunit RsxC [Frisingicoccus sp.]|nr:electron transport complex subunit RsxC [Frisingicoccus sp.]
MKHLFFGGIHPNDRKELSAGSDLVADLKPAQVTISMSQHIGVPCQPLVAVGDLVKKGQKIGDGEGLCVPVHASVSGKVIAVEKRRHPGGNEVMAVVIENDYQDTQDTTMVPYGDYSNLENDEIISIIREAGIVGMGGATFSTNIKVSSSENKVDTVIANACECEPYITADDVLLRTHPEHVLEGMKIIRQVLKPERMVLAVEDNKKDAIKILKDKIDKEEGIELSVLPTRYPQGAEKQLIQAVTGREVESGQLPASVGCAVFNAATFAAVYKAVCLGQPVTERIVTVTGEGVKNPGNYAAPIGISFAELVDKSGGLTDDVWKVISGGPMMGIAQKDLETSIVKGTNSILCLSQAQNGETENPVCIRCGKCLTVCPMRLEPLYMYCYEKAEDVDGLEQKHVLDCIECGCCAYACPGKLPLVESFRNGKRMVREGQNK